MELGFSLIKTDVVLIMSLFESVERHLQYNEIKNVNKEERLKLIRYVDSNGLLQRLEDMQRHPNTKIYQKAKGIIEKYFIVEPDSESPMETELEH